MTLEYVKNMMEGKRSNGTKMNYFDFHKIYTTNVTTY